MKRLFLVRHAKSSWDDASLPDKERPLNERGEREAPKMGKRLAKRDVKPDLILSSSAKRALATTEIIAEKLDYERDKIVVDDRLYGASARDLLQIIHKLPQDVKSVMLVGHNPELTDLAHRLAPKIIDMPTCAVAELTFDTKSWPSIGDDKPAKVVFHDPKGS